MPHYIRHHFDPDFNHQQLKPRETDTGSVDHYNLGYTQNVIKGQLLAELLPLEEVDPETVDRRFVVEKPILPMGMHTRINPVNPSQLLADANGYVFYLDGRIAVKRLLNVRRDVDFHTGNVVFVNDVVVHGSVRTGFSVQGRNILVKDLVEGAVLTAEESIVLETGVKGAKRAELNAGKSMRMPFAESATLMTGENLLIDGSCLHCSLYVGRNLAVRERLLGCSAYCSVNAVIHEQLGGGDRRTLTQVILGYDPALLHKLEVLEYAIEDLQEELAELESNCAKSLTYREEYGEKCEAMRKKLGFLRHRRQKMTKKLEAGQNLEECRLAVPGEVRPNVEISIGQAFLRVTEPLRDVFFYLDGDEIAVGSPALKRK